MAWNYERLSKEERFEIVRLGRALTLLEGLILVSLHMGTYYRSLLGSTLEEADDPVVTPERRLISMGLLRESSGYLEMTPKGRCAAQRYRALMAVVMDRGAG